MKDSNILIGALVGFLLGVIVGIIPSYLNWVEIQNETKNSIDRVNTLSEILRDYEKNDAVLESTEARRFENRLMGVLTSELRSLQEFLHFDLENNSNSSFRYGIERVNGYWASPIF